MRSRISIQKISKHPIPYDYQYGLASMLYGKLAEANIKLANELHSHQNFKFFTFSNFIIEDKKSNRKGLDFDCAHFFLTSPDIEFVRSFAEGLLQAPEFHLGRVRFVVRSIEILGQREFDEECDLKTLSPIYVKTLRKVNGEMKEWDLYPTEGKFYENLHNNLKTRYEEFYGYPVQNDYFEVTKLHSFKGRRINIDGSYRRCSLMRFKLNANPEYIKFGYEAGFGEKNAMGFGCVEVDEGAG